MNILVIGSGGREHSLAWKAAQSASVDQVFVAPGNAGTAREPALSNVAIDTMDFTALADFAEANNVGLTLVGPEAPLVAGVVDYFRSRNLACFGPSKAAAQLEGSKSFTKDFLKRHAIPTASYQTFTEVDAAKAYIRAQGAPIVIKADGLAAGKGVIVAETLGQAEDAVKDMLSGNAFGDAGCKVVIEEFLVGEEASFIVMVDGKNSLAMATSQDHKRASNGDLGPNTGGMGAYSPAPVVTDALWERAMDEIIRPTVAGMAADGNTYTGFLYAGLMISPTGSIDVVEFNCRFGDPEAQPVMMRLQSDLVEHCLAAVNGTLDTQIAQWDPRPAVGIVLAAGGYPESYTSGETISGLDDVQEDASAKVFHAGTKLQDGNLITSGGRVLCVVGLADTVKAAQQKAYSAIKQIHFDGMQYRNDIGFRAIK